MKLLRDMSNTAVLLIDCPDRKGLVATVSGLLYRYGANILHADQHQDREARLFFMRVEWALDGFDLESFQTEFEGVAAELHMHSRLELSARLPPVALFVSKYQHCFVDLLHRHDIGELRCSIPLIISNHTDAQPLADFYNIPFHHVPVTSDNRDEAERVQLALMAENKVELVVLARYMQVLSPSFVAHFPAKIINVHHSFLPAFTGGRPYHAAFARGVKLIGATSHYVTDVLDEGPIIEQDVARISHRSQVEDLIEKGRDLERLVLSRAVRWHLESRILCYENKTVIFD